VLDREVAVKLLRRQAMTTESRARLLREAQALARVTSPHVVAVHDVGVATDQVYVAMELVAGGTLRRWLQDRPRSWREILRVLEAAGRGLAAVHRRGLVHRDFKPDNVLVDGDRVQVADFGLAAATHRIEPAADLPDAECTPLREHLTCTGALVGTPAYMAPELFFRAPADARSDQFAFCVTCYEALCGVRPFAGVTFEELVRAERAGELRPPQRRVPAWLRAIVERGLASHPERRHESMDALLEQIERRRVRGPRAYRGRVTRR
jgi:serine/threonine protein kinase